MTTRGRRNEQVRGVARPVDDTEVAVLDVAPPRWLAARRRVRALITTTVVLGVLLAAAGCALVQLWWPPMLLSSGGVVLSAVVVVVVGVLAVPVGRRVAARSVRPVLDEVRAAVDVAPSRPTALDPCLTVLLGRDTTLLRASGRRTVVGAVVGDERVRLVRVPSPRHGHHAGGVSVPVAGAFYGTGDGGWGGGDGGGGGSC